MNLKHKSWWIVSVFIVLSLLPALPSIAQDPVTVTFWHVWGGPRLEMIDSIIADFEAENPGIHIEHTLIDQGGMAERYLTAIAGGDPPDVIMVHAGRFFPAFANRGVLMDLSPFVERDGLDLESIFVEADLQTYLWEGIPYAMPLSTGGGGWNFFYDVDAFEAAGLDPDSPPTTWQELEEYAVALTMQDGDDFSQIGFSPASITNYPFKEWLLLNNGQLISEDGRTVLFNSPEGLETLEWMKGFYDRVYGGFENVLDLTGDPEATGRNARNIWYNNELAMHIDGVWHLAQLESSAPEKNVRAALMPYNGNNPDAGVSNVGGNGWGYGIPVGSAHPEEAWEWVKYTTAGQGNHDFFLMQGRPTPVTEFNADPAFAENNPFWDVFIANLDASIYVTNTPVQAETDELIQQMTEEVLFGNMSPAEALEWAATESQQIIDEYWASQ